MQKLTKVMFRLDEEEYVCKRYEIEKYKVCGKILKMYIGLDNTLIKQIKLSEINKLNVDNPLILADGGYGVAYVFDLDDDKLNKLRNEFEDYAEKRTINNINKYENILNILRSKGEIK